jgi:hypothetical protein
MIVDRVPQSLLAAEVTLCGLDTHVPQEKLDLLEFFSGLMAQPSTRAPEIMWRDLGEAALRTRLLYNSPYHFRTEPFYRNSASLVDSAENRPAADFSG